MEQATCTMLINEIETQLDKLPAEAQSILQQDVSGNPFLDHLRTLCGEAGEPLAFASKNTKEGFPARAVKESEPYSLIKVLAENFMDLAESLIGYSNPFLSNLFSDAASSLEKAIEGMQSPMEELMASDPRVAESLAQAARGETHPFNANRFHKGQNGPGGQG